MAVQALDEVSPARLLVVLLITLLLVLHGLVPRNFLVDGTSLGLLGILVVLILVPLLDSATLPGGGGLAFRKRIEQLERVAGDLEHESGSSAPLTAAITAEGTVSASLTDQPTAPKGPGLEVESVPVRTLPPTVGLSMTIVGQVLEATSRSPKLGLMLLAAELEAATRQLLAGSGWGNTGEYGTLQAGVNHLVDLGVLPKSLPSAVDLFRSVRNEVVHGHQTPKDDAIIRAVDSGLAILAAINAVPRERHVVDAIDVIMFRDADCTTPIDDCRGLRLRNVSPSGLEVRHQIFPTTRTWYQPGREVTWQWNAERQWGPAWYRDESSVIHQGWVGSMEFVGRDLEEV